MRDQGGKIIRLGGRIGGVGMGSGVEFSERSVFVEDNNEGRFPNFDGGSMNFNFEGSYEGRPVQFSNVEQPQFDFFGNVTDNFQDLQRPFQEDWSRRLGVREKGNINKDFKKLNNEREEQMRFEKERKNLERERRELADLRKTIDQERQKLEILKRTVDVDDGGGDGHDESVKCLGMGQDSGGKFSDSEKYDDEGSKEIKLGYNLKDDHDLREILLNNKPVKKPLLTTPFKKPLLKTPPTTERIDSASNRMPAAGILNLLHKNARAQAAVKGHNEISRNENLSAESNQKRPRKEIRAMDTSERPVRGEFDVMQGPKRIDFNDNSRGIALDRVSRGIGSNQEQNRDRFGLNQEINRAGISEVLSQFEDHSQRSRSGRFNEAAIAGFDVNKGISSVHEGSRGRGFIMQRSDAFNESSRGGSGFNEGLRGKSGFNEGLRGESGFNEGARGGTGFNEGSRGAGGFNEGGFGEPSGSRQPSQFRRGNYNEMQNVDNNRNTGMGSLFRTASFSSNSSMRSETGLRENTLRSGMYAVSSRSFREDEYHFRGGESSSGGNFPNAGNFGRSPIREYNSPRKQVQSFGRSSIDKLSNDMTLASYNEFKKPDDNLKQNPSQIRSKRTIDERTEKILSRRRKRLLAAIEKLRPAQTTKKVNMDKELKELEYDLRRRSEKCYQQRQLARQMAMRSN